jgi:hypothetical protein
MARSSESRLQKCNLSCEGEFGAFQPMYFIQLEYYQCIVLNHYLCIFLVQFDS